MKLNMKKLLKKIQNNIMMIILAGFLLINVISCISESDDLNQIGYEYEVMDTVSVSQNGFGQIFGYEVIIKIDNSYYTGAMTPKGIVHRLDRKLKLQYPAFKSERDSL